MMENCVTLLNNHLDLRNEIVTSRMLPASRDTDTSAVMLAWAWTPKSDVMPLHTHLDLMNAVVALTEPLALHSMLMPAL